MAKLTKAQQKTKVADTIKVNGNKEITPPKDKILRDDQLDSSPNWKDGGYEFEAAVGYLTELSVSDPKAFIALFQTQALIAAAVSGIDVSNLMPKSAGVSNPFTGDVYLGDNSIRALSFLYGGNGNVALSLSGTSRKLTSSTGAEVFDFGDLTNGPAIVNGGGFKAFLKSLVTGNKIFNIPDKSDGDTIAFLSDVGSTYTGTAGETTITGTTIGLDTFGTFTAGAGTVTGGDKPKSAIQKLDGNILLRELLSNKATGFGTLNNNLFPSVLATQLFVGHVTPEIYGALGDGSTNDAAAIQLAFDSGFPVFFSKKNYRITTAINIPTGAMAFGSGYQSIVSTTSNISLFELGGGSTNGNNIHISDLTFLGNNSGAAQRGISVVGVGAFTTYRISNKVTNCAFINLNQAGIYCTNVIGFSSGTQHQGSIYATNCHASGCGDAYYMDTRGEYNTFSNCVAYLSTGSGLRIKAGNINWTGGQITNNAIGVRLEAGANDAHGSVTGCKINHNTTNISCILNANPFIFNGNDIYAGDIIITSAGHIKFIGNEFSTNTITHTSSSVSYIGNTFKTQLTTANFLVAAGDAPQGDHNKFIAGNISLFLQSRGVYSVGRSVTSATTTGTTAETIVHTILIPAGTIEAGDILNWKSSCQFTGSANSKTIRYYFNTVANLTGSPVQVGQYNTSTPTVQSQTLSREMSIETLTSQSIQPLAATTLSNEYSGANDPLLNTTINFAVNQYLIQTAQLTNSGETIVSKSLSTLKH